MDVVKFWREKTGHIEGLSHQLKRMQEINMCGSPQPEYLFSLAYLMGVKGAVVEIGTCSGISLISLAIAQKLKGRDPVISIDIAKHNDLDRNLSNASVNDYAECIISDANDLAKEWSTPIAMLWIDGDHSYNGAAKDIAAWSKFIIDGGYIALHDYNSSCGVYRAISKLILSHPWMWRVISDREYGSIFVAQKIATESTSWKDPTSNWYRVKSRTKRAVKKILSIAESGA